MIFFDRFDLPTPDDESEPLDCAGCGRVLPNNDLSLLCSECWAEANLHHAIPGDAEWVDFKL